ncbi:hypothetical protein UFOVP126_4 [uncultured Caudovirales phage]|uniref:Uncharacterized protein n=1 Tax=uncultured Caudovirales phage TaxID=2100421 RepID=A0A6J5LBS3_9CAUD|nr:hypothetical protein UFOVP126_4 [uncultured Caudovirales phage]
MRDWAEALIAAMILVGVVLWSVRVFMGVIYG